MSVPIEVVEHFEDQLWRLNNLYWITDKGGKRVRFQMNDAQLALYHEMWYRNVILKARQRGYTTAIDLFALDSAIFNDHFLAGIIAHNVDDAKVIFRTKVKFPYDNLPEALRTAVHAESDRADELLFANHSSIRVSTSYRSGTLQLLHVSEYGKIAAKYPDKANEIKTGAFEAVAKDQMIFVESTAEGMGGNFYDLCVTSQRLAQQEKPLTHLDFKFFFEPWWANPEYELPDELVIVDKGLEQYFDELEAKLGIAIRPGQRAWYSKKFESLGEDMWKEYPSTPEEAFQASVHGAYYASEMAKMRRQGRITTVPYDPMLPVDTFWDLGMDDSTSIWFHQFYGTSHRLIDYYENHGEGLPHYVNVLAEKDYVYGKHFLPHDVKVKEMNDGKTRLETLRRLGVRPIVIAQKPKNTDALMDQIQTVRAFLGSTWIDEKHCAEGIKHLDNYRKEWDEKLAAFKRTPLHNEACHGADALRTGAKGWRTTVEYDADGLEPEPDPGY